MIKQIIDLLTRFLKPVTSNLDKVSWLVLFLMMIYTMIDVLVLKIINYSLLGTVEMTALMMVICIFFSFARTELDDGHIRVDFLYNRLGKRTQAVCDFTTQFLCTILFGFMGWATLLNGFEKLESSEVTMDLLMPVYPFAFVAAAGCCLTCVVLLIRTLEALNRMMNP